MRAMMCIELRRPALLLGWSLLLVGQLGMMLTDVAQWRGIWPMASAAVGAPWLFLAPAAAGLSAYDTIRRRPPAGDTVTWRAVTTVMLAARLLLVAGIVGIGALCASTLNVAAGAPEGSLWPSYLVVTLSHAVWSVMLGMLVGSFGGPTWFPPVVAVLLAFLRTFWFQGAGPQSAGAGLERVFLAGRPWNELDPAAVGGAVAEAVLLVLLALVGPTVLARVRARQSGATFKGDRGDRVRLAAVAVVATMCASLVLTSPPIVRDRTPPRELPCTSTRPQVCVWPENARLLPDLAEKASRADGLAQEVDGRLMARLDEFGLGGDDSFVGLGQGTWFFSDTLAGALASSLAPVTCDPPGDDPQLATFLAARYELAALFQLQIEDRDWPSGYGRSSGIDADGVSRIWQASAAERDAWISQRVTTMRQSVAGWCA